MADLFRAYSLNILGIEVTARAAIMLEYVAPFILVLLTLTTVYKIVPHVSVPVRFAFAGGMFVTVFWEVAKHIFTWMVRHVSYIGTIYGSLTTFILFLLWMYYLSCIFLLGAELVKTLRERSHMPGL